MAFVERFLDDDDEGADRHDVIERRLDEAAENEDRPPRKVDAVALIHELRQAIELGQLSANAAEALAGYSLMRSIGASLTCPQKRLSLVRGKCADWA